MTQHIAHIGKAMTAIAAVLAFTVTPAVAQDTGTPPDPSADTSTAAPATSDPLAPEPVTTDTATPPAPTPKVEASRTARAKPATKPVAARSTTRPTAKPAATAAPAPAPTATLAGPAVETAPPAMPPIGPGAMPEPDAPPAVETKASNMPDSIDELMANDMALPVAGAAALGLLALGGTGIAMRRRKRRREDEEFAARQQFLDAAEAETEAKAEPPLELKPTDAVGAGPAFARRQAPIHDPVPANKAAATTKLPEGFDLSRFGPHVQAAYRGPTPDNPSVSLKYRLSRAAALDQQERRMAAQAGHRPDVAAPAQSPATSSMQSHPRPNFILRRAGQPAKDPADA